MEHSNIPMREDPTRLDTVRHIREIRRILRSTNLPEEHLDARQPYRIKAWIWLGGIILAILTLWLVFGGIAHAEAVDVNRLATAIYKAENSKTWPYGIKHHYKHTSARRACLNTINHRLRLWNGQGDFVVYLGQTYSPPAINPNWVRLVKWFYARGNNETD